MLWGHEVTTETTETTATGSEAAQNAQPNAVPGQETAALAQQHDDAGEQADQSQDSEGGEKLTEEQKTIRKLQRRIDRLTAGKGAAQREAELLRVELERRGQAAQPPAQDDDGQKKAVDPQDIDRLATERAQQLHRQQTVASRANAVIESGQKLPGFDQAVNTVAEEVPFTDRKGMPTPFIEAVLDTDEPAKLLHYLGNNPDEAAKFANLTPAQIGRQLAKLEERMARESAKTTSSAPAPLRPVQSRSTPDNEPQDSDSMDVWARKDRARTIALQRRA